MREASFAKMAETRAHILLFLQFVLSVNCFNILVVNNFPLRSHNEVSHSVVRHLLHVGHQVSYITAVSTEKHTNLTQIIYDIDEPLAKTGKLNISDWLYEPKISLSDYLETSIRVTSKVIKAKSVQDLLRSNNVKFDLVVAFWNFNELISGISSIFSCPIVWVSLHEPNRMSFNLLLHEDDTNIFNEHIEPETLTDTFKSIVHNVRLHILYLTTKSLEGKLFPKLYLQATSSRQMTLPPYLDVVANSSMVLYDTHSTIGLSHAMPSNAKYIGGVHFDQHGEPMPKDLQNILDTHTAGVIYFNLGKDVDSSTLPSEIVSNLLKMFGGLKQKVFWKYEGALEGVPTNVYIRKILPQGDILAHHNTLVFINSGELSSLNEAVHYGVPVIGIPLYLDHNFNVHLMQKKAYGLRVQFNNKLASHLKTALMTILQDPSYSVKAQALSDIYYDRIMSPAEELVHWVEHVIHTKGARHLSTPESAMPWYRHQYFDQNVTSSIIFLLIIFCAYKLCRKHCCNSNKGKVIKRGRKE